MNAVNQKIILYGVLNWGLGHATRSVQIIEALIVEGYKVVIASDGLALDYLKNRFPNCETETLPAYNISYAKGSAQLLKMASQLPKIAWVASQEKRSVAALVKKYKPLGLISDNRLGFYSPKVPSVYITHQLRLIMPILSDVVSKLHHLFIKKYDECWVPDIEQNGGLAGDLSHRIKVGIPIRYIGPLSALKDVAVPTHEKKVYDVLVILSGPEPQRSLLEKALMDELYLLDKKCVVVRGVKNGKPLHTAGTIEVMDMASAAELGHLISKAKMVVSRSGYSSIMDYYYLGNKALLIPTPGQAEQEYLARYQLHKGRFTYVAQEAITLKESLEKAEGYRGFGQEDIQPPDWPGLFSLFQGKGKDGSFA